MSIRNWNTNNLKYSISPVGLYLGDNPSSYNSGTFPIYQGPSAGSKITGTLTNMLTNFGYIDFGRVLFDGTNDHIVINTYTAWSNTNNFTFENYIQYFQNSTEHCLFSEGTDSSNYFQISITAAYKIKVLYKVGGVSKETISTDTLSSGVKYIAVRKTGATTKIYVDGSEVSAYDSQDSYNLGSITHTYCCYGGLLHSLGFMLPSVYDLYVASIYDEDIGENRISANYNFGRYWDGLRGSDNGDDTMSLVDPGSVSVTGTVKNYKDLQYCKICEIRSEMIDSDDTYVPINITEHHFDDEDLFFQNVQNNNGSDIVATDINNNEIPFKLNSFDKSAKTIDGILRAPNISTTTNQQVIIHYGGTTTRSIDSDLVYEYPKPNGVTWTTQTSAADNNWLGLATNGEIFVAVSWTGTGNRVMTSPDGKIWTIRSTPQNNFWSSVAWGNGKFVAVAQTGTNRVITSPDGVNWTLRNASVNNAWVSVIYNNQFVAVAATGTGDRVMTSPDGITWTTRTSAADNDWYDVAWSGTIYAAVAATGTGNRVMTSPDGITWTTRTSAADNDWVAIYWDSYNSLFVATAQSGTGNRVMTSPDGITWTLRTSAADNSWYDILSNNGINIACSYNGTNNRIQTSQDGITWTTRTSAANNSWRKIRYAKGTYVVIGDSGTGDRVMTNIHTFVKNNEITQTVNGALSFSLQFSFFKKMYYPKILLPETKHVTPTDGSRFVNNSGQAISARGILIGTDGDICIRMASGKVVNISSGTFLTGVIHYIEFVEVRYTGTTAENIYAFFREKVQ